MAIGHIESKMWLKRILTDVSMSSFSGKVLTAIKLDRQTFAWDLVTPT